MGKRIRSSGESKWISFDGEAQCVGVDLGLLAVCDALGLGPAVGRHALPGPARHDRQAQLAPGAVGDDRAGVVRAGQAWVSRES
jgi:hypothetical protein